MQLLRSILYTGSFMLWTFLYGIFFSLVCPFLPFRRRFSLARFWALVLVRGCKWICGLDYRIRGQENLPQGSHVALWKHASTWETFAMAVVIPPQVWVLKRELTWIPFVGWGILLLHAIAIDRKSGRSAGQQVVDQGKQRLAEGSWVVIFPEGTRVPAGETRKYGASGAMLASEAGVMIVPIAHDAGYYWPRRGVLKKRGVIDVSIGPPIAARGRHPREINEEAQRWIEAEIVRIRTEKNPISAV